MTPMPQRMNQRLADWGGLWTIRQDNAPCRPSLQQPPKQQAQSLDHCYSCFRPWSKLPSFPLSCRCIQVMLPKNQKLERPITLTSTLWRVWCRLRKPLLDKWQQHLPASMNHDKARPGANVLHVALEQLLRQEVTKARKQHGMTVLVDMSTFYDTINLARLQEEALKLQYPPLMLERPCSFTAVPKPSWLSKR